jgi:predicted transcriptional regulator
MTPKPTISISDAEAVVMEVLWRESAPLTTEAVVTALANQQQWQEATIKTLLNRLLNKQAIRATKDGRRYLYSPVLRREQWVSAESEGLLDRLFGGRVAPLVAHFGKHRKLSKKDIAELKRLIGELDDGR